jgi:hypothetical protein
VLALTHELRSSRHGLVIFQVAVSFRSQVSCNFVQLFESRLVLFDDSLGKDLRPKENS